MFSTRKCAKGEKSSEREDENEPFTFNFLVHGSSVPIHNQEPKTMREYKSCQVEPKRRKRKEFSFPLDKIIYLSERLELMSLTEKKVKTISLSAVDVDDQNSFQELQVMNQRGSTDSKPASRVTTPAFDFSLDLSSISNTGDESDENCDPPEKETVSYRNTKSSSPLDSGKECGETSRGPGCSPRNRTRFSFEEWKKPKTESLDSVNVYVNTVNKQKDLVKFFRLCRNCSEPSCVCPRQLCRSDLHSFGHPPERYESSVRGYSCSYQGSVSDGQFECECASCPFFGEKEDLALYSEIGSCGEGIFETDCFPTACGKKCECRNDSSDSDRILAYTSSLACAARSARILARDLEFILSTLSTETKQTRRDDPQISGTKTCGLSEVPFSRNCRDLTEFRSLFGLLKKPESFEASKKKSVNSIIFPLRKLFLGQRLDGSPLLVLTKLTVAKTINSDCVGHSNIAHSKTNYF